LHRSLQFKVGIAVLGTIVSLSAIYAIWDAQSYRKRFLGELQETAGNLSNVTLNGLIRMAMIGKHPKLLQESIQELANDPMIVGVYLLDPQGTVRFAGDPGFIGHRFSTKDDGCRECHSLSGGLPKSMFLEGRGVRVLRTVAPVENRSECHSCHSPQQRWIGMLIVDSATAGIEDKLSSRRNQMLVKAGITLFAMIGVLGILINRLVIRRLTELTAATSTILTEDPNIRVLRQLVGHDEIGQLAAAFNQMTLNLGRYRREVQEKDRIRGLLLEKIVRVQEDERKKVSRELHDQVGQALSALLLAIETNESCGSCRNGCDWTAKIRKLIHEVHHLAWEMRPTILDDYGLDSALQMYIEEISANSSVAVDYQQISSPELARIPAWIEVTLYRVAQEALTNVVRHSRANRASVILIIKKKEILLLVEDDGCGFQLPLNGNGSKGLGLVGMQERVGLCGGTWTVESAQDCGTTIKVTIPWGRALS